jgi:hypothetical protein
MCIPPKSNAIVENWNRTVKQCIFPKRVPLPEFLQTMHDQTNKRAKEMLYMKNKHKPKNDMKDTAHIIEKERWGKRMMKKGKTYAQRSLKNINLVPKKSKSVTSQGQQNTVVKDSLQSTDHVSAKIETINSSVIDKLTVTSQAKVNTVKSCIQNTNKLTVTSQAKVNTLSSVKKVSNKRGIKSQRVINVSDDDEKPIQQKRMWLKHYNLDEEAKHSLMTRGTWLSSDIIYPVIDVLRKAKPDIQYFTPYDVFSESINVKSLESYFVCIINTNFSLCQKAFKSGNFSEPSGSHWVCLSNVGVPKDNDAINIGVYNSIESPPSDDLKQFVQTIYKDYVAPIRLLHYRVQHQPDTWSCGLHAVSNAVTLAMGEDPVLKKFDTKKMAHHTKALLETGKVSPFPVADEWDSYGLHENRAFGPNGEAKPYEEIISLTNNK